MFFTGDSILSTRYSMLSTGKQCYLLEMALLYMDNRILSTGESSVIYWRWHCYIWKIERYLLEIACYLLEIACIYTGDDMQ